MKSEPKTPMYPIFHKPIKEEVFGEWAEGFTRVNNSQEYRDYVTGLSWMPHLFPGPCGVIIHGKVYSVKGCGAGYLPRNVPAIRPKPMHATKGGRTYRLR